LVAERTAVIATQRSRKPYFFNSVASLVINSTNPTIKDINDLYKNRLNEAEIKIDTLAEAREKMEELVKSQSCINFAE
jgi:hypothetical protein